VTTVIGLDLSLTNTGIAHITWNDDEVMASIQRAQSKGSKTDTWEARSVRILNLANEIQKRTLPAALVVVEGPSFSSVSVSSHDRSWLWGKVFDRMMLNGVPVVVVPPASAKKWATGKGNADKDDMMLAAARMWPALDEIKNDTADALALAGIGMQLLGGPCPFPVHAYRSAVVDKLRDELAVA